MKYTAKDIREQEIAFGPLTEEQFLKLQKHFHKLYPEDRYNIYGYKEEATGWRFYGSNIFFNSIGWISEGGYTDIFFLGSEAGASKEISYGEFDFEEEFQLPEKWACHVTEDNIEVMKKYVTENYKSPINLSKYKSFTVENVCICNHPDGSCIYYNFGPPVTPPGYTIITFEQFKEHVLKQKEEKMYNIKTKEFLRIIECACPEWKDKLTNYAKSNFHISLGVIEVSQEMLDRMLSAAVTRNGIDQKKVIEEVFGIVKEDPYKVFKDAIKEGKEVQIYSSITKIWFTQKTYNFTDDPKNYRIKHKHQDLIDLWKKDKTQVVQYKGSVGKTWHNCGLTPLWSEDREYRILPKEEYVPFDFSDAKELIGQRVGIYGGFRVITKVFDGGKLFDGGVELGNTSVTFKHLFDRATFLDGTKCGKLKS